MMTQNILGHPVTTVTGASIGAAQYLVGQGVAAPHDWLGWLQLVVMILTTVIGALARDPGTQTQPLPRP